MGVIANVANVKVGRRDVSPSKPSHTAGVREGNAPKKNDKDTGLRAAGAVTKGTARRSTGINAKDREPIDPRSPNLSPP